jgi:hypothetical protein
MLMMSTWMVLVSVFVAMQDHLTAQLSKTGLRASLLLHDWFYVGSLLVMVGDECCSSSTCAGC